MEILKHHNKLAGYLRKTINNPSDIEDILQNAYLKYLEKSKKVTIKDPFSYLFKILKYEVKEYYRNITRNKYGYVEKKTDILEKNVSYNDGEFNYDLQVHCNCKIKYDTKVVKTRATMYKRNNLIYKEEPKNFKESLVRRKVIKFRKVKTIDTQILRKDLEDNLKNLQAKKMLSYDKDIITELLSVVNFDLSINVIRLYPTGFNCLSTNNIESSRLSIQDSHDQKSIWIYIKDSKIQML